MTDNHLANTSSSGRSDPRQEIASAIARYTRRLRLLTGLVIALWAIAGVGIVLLTFGFFVFVYPALQRDAHGIWGPGLYPAGMTVVWIAMGCLFLAAIGTVYLVFTSRRLTLTQIGKSLAEISEQMKSLQQIVAAKN